MPYKQHVYINVPAYLIAIYDIGFYHSRALSQYTRFVADQVHLKNFLQLISDNYDDNFTKLFLILVGK